MKDTILQKMFESYYAIQNLKESILVKNNREGENELRDIPDEQDSLGNLWFCDDKDTYKKVVEILDIVKTMLITKMQAELPKEAKK